MSKKQLRYGAEAREKILRGATALADAVRVTLGPKSKCVLMEKKWGKPLVCNDGVAIAREIELEDGEENLGAQMMRQAAERTGDEGSPRTGYVIRVSRGSVLVTRFISHPARRGRRPIVAVLGNDTAAAG